MFADQRIVTDQRTGTVNDGTDTLKSIERLIFTDSGLAFDLDSSAGKVAKLIEAVFGAESLSNAGYLHRDFTLLIMTQAMKTLPLWRLTATGAKTPEQITSLLWENVMGSTPTADDIQPYINMLNSGLSVGKLGVLAVDGLKNQLNIDLVGLSETGITFDPLHYQLFA